MANYYVWSGATGTGTGATWANAYTTLAAANDKAGNDFIYVAHDHSELTASSSLGHGPASGPASVKIVCVNRAGSVPPVSADRRATAVVATSGNGSISFGDCAHYDGIIFIAGNSTGNANIDVVTGDKKHTRFDNCSLRLGSTGTAGRIRIPNTTSWYGPYCEMNNTTVSFANASQCMELFSVLRWTNTSPAVLGTAPTILMQCYNGNGPTTECIGLDLSAVTGTIVGSGGTQINTAANYRFVDCKLNAAATLTTAINARGARFVDFVRSGSAGVNYAVASIRYGATLIHETGIVRTSGGASDGTTPISWRVATTANCTYSVPFECPPIAIWNDTVGSAKTATVEGIWGGGSPPLDTECWLECEYLGSSSSPVGSFAADCAADLLATAAAQTTSAASWNTTPSFTPASLTGLIGWWDASNTASLTLSGGGTTVDAVADLSGAGNHLTWTNAKPTYSATGFNSRPAVTTDATTGQALQKTSFPMGTGNTLTAFYVGSLGASSSNPSGRFFSYRGPAQSTDYNNVGSWVLSRNTGTQVMVTRNGADSAANSTAHPAPHRIIVTINSSGVITIYIDGVPTVGSTVAGNWLTGGTLGIGRNIVGGGESVSAPFVEWGIATGYSDATAVAQLDAYLSAKAVSAFKLSTTFTAQQKGWVYCRVKCAKASSAFFIDPLVTLT